MANKMLIDATHPEETRVVVVRGNRVEEFDFEAESRRQLRGNIYLAKVTRVEPSLQAAFIEYGGNRHGFLAFSEIHPDYYQIPVADRQNLIDEEERAHRDADADADRRASRSGGRRRHSNSRSNAVRRSEPIENTDTQNAQHEDGSQEGSMSEGGVSEGSTSLTNEVGNHADTPATQHETGAFDGAEAFHDAAPQDHTDGASHEDSTPSEVRADETAPIAGAEFSATSGHVPAAEDHTHHERGDHHSDAHGDHDDAHDDHTHDDHTHADHTHDDHAHDDHSGTHAENGNGHHDHGREIDEVGGDDEEDIVESVGGADALDEVQERMPRLRRQYKIQEVIKRRQVMLVQVVKEERGSKGAALTTYLSLAGRYSVLMPNTARGGGISRKITSAEDRKRLKQIAHDLEVPEGMGVILRTAGANRTKAEVKRDFEYLLRMWETVRDLTLKSSAPKLVYEEGSLVKRSIRDLYNKDIEEVVVAGDDAYREAKDFMRMLMPSHAKNVKPYKDGQPLFTRSGIESQLDAMFSPVVQLRSGGYLVLNQTEALVAIDVNSGRATREHHIEDTALKTNLEAAEEISRQLRLRDLAGLVVIDFIDMDENRNNRAVERKLKECLKNDRARIQVGRISHFGLMEMSRQRLRSSMLESSTEKCPHCGGTGHVRSVSSVTLQLLRSLEEMLLKGATHNLVARTNTEVALYVLNHKRAHLRDLEARFQIAITINADAAMNGQQPFLVERGEQVHSVEAARAIAARPGAIAIAPPDDDDDDLDEVAEAEAEAEDIEFGADEESESTAFEPRARAENGADGEADAENGGKRRRRRRRRGRRGGSGEAGGADDTRTPSEASAHDENEDEAGEEARAESAPAEHGASSGGAGTEESERRRRRRGRRGGRRNRREHEGEARPGDDPQAADPQVESGWQEWAENPQSDAVEPPVAHVQPAAESAPEQPPMQPAPTAGFEPAVTPEPARPAPKMTPIETSPAVEQVAVRRRSTIREPAPMIGGASNVTPLPDPVPEIAPPPRPAASEPAQAEDKPRRAGWWSRKILGKG